MNLFTLQQNMQVLPGIKGKYLSRADLGPNEILYMAEFDAPTGAVVPSNVVANKALVLIRDYGPNKTTGHTHSTDALVQLEDGQAVSAYGFLWEYIDGELVKKD